MKSLARLALAKNLALTILTALSVVAPAAAAERKLYTGVDSSEYAMTYVNEVEIDSAREPSLSRVNEAIEAQVVHLFGSMAANTRLGVPKTDHKTRLIEVTRKGPATFAAVYEYTGTVVVRNGRGPLQVALPINPQTVFSAGLVGSNNPCTDHHYQSEGDFWYFWNPFNLGCRLQQGRDYKMVHVELAPLSTTTQSFPEYDRLVDATGTIKVSILMGLDKESAGKDPNRSADVNADNFRDVKASLLQSGYEVRRVTPAELRRGLPEGTVLPWVEQFTKTVSRQGREIRILVEIFFGASGIDESSTAFHYYLKDALENSSVMIYAGHSGLGGHLDLAAIERAQGFAIQPNLDRYQIYFFNSCSSYPYYNTMYFGRKASILDPKGTKNLDILTNGLATYFSVIGRTNLAVVRAIELWASGRTNVSYQTLARQIESNNLFGVNGDENNPTK